ncbi:MAG TPA: branched-chain amino acid ABC transporter permease, partial [Candidatus Acidoferrum sp.]|nr:branched-chain amino acid ABC transporter permease [Candidatus Acidoferrum sp.]
ITIGGAICGLMALLIGRYTMRLRGAYFGIATLAFAEAVRQIVLEFYATFKVSLFEGSHGITLPIAHDLLFFYYTFLGAAAVIVGASWFIHRSKFGYALRAIRESEIAAELSGVPTLRHKVSAYAVTGFFIGLLGGIHAYWLSYISPGDVFSISHTIYMIIMALLGGMGTVFGPVLGAVLLSLANELLAAEFLYTYFLLLGVLLLAVIFFLPRGVGGLFSGKRMPG